jgi:hypothetical protein
MSYYFSKGAPLIHIKDFVLMRQTPLDVIQKSFDDE